MSHDTHEQHKENKTIISFKNSFWLVIIILGLFIAALNFIKAESSDEGEGKEKTEAKVENGQSGEKTEQKAEAPKPAEATPADTAAKASK